MGDFQANFHRPTNTGIYTAEGNVAGNRAAQLEKKRQRDQELFEERKRQLRSGGTGDDGGGIAGGVGSGGGGGGCGASSLSSMSSKFTGSSRSGGGASSESDPFKSKTVGLVTAEQFKAAAAEAAAAAADSTSGFLSLTGMDPLTSTDKKGANDDRSLSEEQRKEKEKQRKRAKKKKLKEKKKVMSKLSFAGDEEEENEDVGGPGDGLKGKESSLENGVDAGKSKKNSGKKDPTIDTSFLPDRQRDEYVRQKRLELQREWIQRQSAIQKETLEIVYSYWDGTGHRRTIHCQKGDSVGAFLELVRRELSSEFKELQNVGSDSLLYVKEDLIIPHDYTFYDLIQTKARGKSGPLFCFDVHDDIRVGAVDSRIEKDESHPGKVVERRWYDRNKHIFPASRWEVYDPAKDYGTYTIRGN